MKRFTTQQMRQLQYRYLQHTGSLEEEPRRINFEGQITKRNALSRKRDTLIKEWIKKCVKQKK